MKPIEIIVFMFVILILVFTFLGRPYFEMKAFNSCTNSNASYFDAVFTDLRVIDCKKDK